MVRLARRPIEIRARGTTIAVYGNVSLAPTAHLNADVQFIYSARLDVPAVIDSTRRIRCLNRDVGLLREATGVSGARRLARHGRFRDETQCGDDGNSIQHLVSPRH